MSITWKPEFSSSLWRKENFGTCTENWGTCNNDAGGPIEVETPDEEEIWEERKIYEKDDEKWNKKWNCLTLMGLNC